MEEKTEMLSVIVCTYNRAGLLEGCLKSLSEQSAKSSDYEVIVVAWEKTAEETLSVYKRVYNDFKRGDS